MDKPTTLTVEDTASKQVYSENATPVSEDANEIYMNQLGLFSEEEQSSSKTTVKASSSNALFRSLKKLLTRQLALLRLLALHLAIPKIWMTRFLQRILAVKSNIQYVRNALKKSP